MSVEVSLFGFGDDKPRPFGQSDTLNVTLAAGQTITVKQTLDQAGFTDLHGLSAMLNGTLVAHSEWDTKTVSDGDALKVLMAIEGG